MSEAEEQATTDPKAPYGRDDDGTPKAPYGYRGDGVTPKKRPGPPPGTPRRVKATAPGRRSAPKRVAKGQTDYRDGLNGMVQIVSTGLALAGTSRREFLADSVAVMEHGPNVAEALNSLAAERPEVAAVLDRVLAVGPYTLVIGAVLPLLLQILGNHGVLPAKLGGALGVRSVDDLLGVVAGQTEGE